MVLFAKETWLMMIAFITFISSLVPFVEGLVYTARILLDSSSWCYVLISCFSFSIKTESLSQKSSGYEGSPIGLEGTLMFRSHSAKQPLDSALCCSLSLLQRGPIVQSHSAKKPL